jgi:hypothetical protein
MNGYNEPMNPRPSFKSPSLPMIFSPLARPVRDPAPVRILSRVSDREADEGAEALAVNRRSKIWELGTTLHCSIIGTCLSTGELRALVRKFNAAPKDNPTDHEIHAMAVGAAGRHDLPAKQIQKALDQRHKATINRFAAHDNANDLRRAWDEAVRNGDIPGGYWAVLTHPAATDALVRHVFGDVHMLSHLVGAANRADIRRLHQLEEEKAALEEKLARQQVQLRDGLTSRDAKIRELNDMLSTRIEQQQSGTADPDRSSEAAALDRLVGDLRKQLDVEIRRRERAEKRAAELSEARTVDERRQTAMTEELAALNSELDAAEERLAALSQSDDAAGAEALSLAGRTILYVGGRPHHIVRLRSTIEQAAGDFLHHDGGVEEKPDLLRGLVSRADIAVFPVDCISHLAAQSLKRLCQQSGKPFMPLRSSGIAALLHALQGVDFAAAEPQAV